MEALEGLLQSRRAAVFGSGSAISLGSGKGMGSERSGRRRLVCLLLWRCCAGQAYESTPASIRRRKGRAHRCLLNLSARNIFPSVYNPGSESSLMNLAHSTSAATLQRRIGLRSAVAFNMLEMIGVGPFITLPLVIAAAGYRLSVWAWVLGAVIAVADGLVWAELGAAFPRAGGSYAFLREIYGPERAGNWLSFLYVWQVSFTAPLSIASGCIGLVELSGLVLAGAGPRADCRLARAARLQLRRRRRLPAGHCAALSQFEFHHAACLGALCRGSGGDCRSDRLRLCAGGGHRRLADAGLARAAAARGAGRAGAGHAADDLLLLGLLQHLLSGRRGAAAGADDSARHSAFGALCRGVLRGDESGRAACDARRGGARCSAGATVRLQLVADIAKSAFGSVAGRLMAALIIWTAFASVFSLLLGYSRVPYAAARDGNYFRFLAAVHPAPRDSPSLAGGAGRGGRGLLLFLAGAGDYDAGDYAHPVAVFLQHMGVMLLRAQRPELPRPFKIPLYPLPPLVAMGGFVFMLVNRSHALGGLAVAAAIAVSGTLIYLIRARRLGNGRLRVVWRR